MIPIRTGFLASPIRWGPPVALLLVLFLVAALAPLRGSAFVEPTVFRPERFVPVEVSKSAWEHEWDSWAGEKPNETWLGEPGERVEPTVQSLDSVEAASEALNRAVRVPAALPAGLSGAPDVQLRTAGSASYTLDLAKLHEALADAGLGDVQLPTSLHGATLVLNQPAGVLLSWEGDGGARLVVAQGRQPTLTVPGQVDVAALRQLLLNHPAVARKDPQAVEQLLSLQDWKTTVPVPVSDGVTARTVRVDGADGLLLSGEHDRKSGSLVIWQRGGVLYTVGGTVSPEAVLAAANSLS